MKRLATAAALLCPLALALTPLARASNDPLGSGAARLALAKPFLAFLKKDKVTLGATAPAERRGTALILPVFGGSLDPTLGRGQIEAEGALLFQDARKRVPLRAIVVKTTHSPLIAKVGGSQLKVATAAQLATGREGFGTELTARRLKLTARVATRLNKKLRPRIPFAAGQPLGTLIAKTQPATTAILPQGRASVALDPTFLAKLNGLFVSVNPIFPAEHQGATFTFPVAPGGALAPDLSQGTLRTGGAVEFLQLGAGQVFWHEPWFEPAAANALAEAEVDPAPPYPGKQGQIGVAGIGAGFVSSEPAARTISLAAAPLTLSAQSAASFNEAFAKPQAKDGVFAAGEAVGSLSFTAQGQ